MQTSVSAPTGVILPGETKTFTFFFKSVNAGIFREFWEFGTHPTLLGGAVLQVNLHAVSLAQDIYRDERTLLEVRKGARTLARCRPQIGHSGVPPSPCPAQPATSQDSVR